MNPTDKVIGGRYDFDDGGHYCGGWADGKAHGHGVCTGPKGLGHYDGEWNTGFEVSGSYTWPSGNVYSGQWQHGKRSGLGTEKKGRWVYRGEWAHGFKGKYGVRTSEASGAKYEGTWTTGFQNGYGMETYADGGTYRGQWMEGMRHGYGVRQSAPYNLAVQYRKKGFAESSSLGQESGKSFQSSMDLPVSEDRSGSLPRTGITALNRAVGEGRGGFVLKSKSPEISAKAGVNPTFRGITPEMRRRSPFTRDSSSLRKTIASTLRLGKNGKTKQDDRVGLVASEGSREAGKAAEMRRAVGPDGSLRSTESVESDHSGLTDNTDASFVSQEYVDDTNVVETYAGEWRYDKRCGYGVSERSDGLKYEGEWFNNKMEGYGVTTLKDGTREEGKYKDNELVPPTGLRASRLFPSMSSRQRERVLDAVSLAVSAAQEAMQRTDIALARVMTARSKAKLAETAAERARLDADLAQKAVKLFEHIPLQLADHSGVPQQRHASITSSVTSSDEQLDRPGPELPAARRNRSFIARVFSSGRGDKKNRPVVEKSPKKFSSRYSTKRAKNSEEVEVNRQNSANSVLRKARDGDSVEGGEAREQSANGPPVRASRMRDLVQAAARTQTPAKTSVSWGSANDHVIRSRSHDPQVVTPNENVDTAVATSTYRKRADLDERGEEDYPGTDFRYCDIGGDRFEESTNRVKSRGGSDGVRGGYNEPQRHNGSHGGYDEPHERFRNGSHHRDVVPYDDVSQNRSLSRGYNGSHRYDALQEHDRSRSSSHVREGFSGSSEDGGSSKYCVLSDERLSAGEVSEAAISMSPTAMSYRTYVDLSRVRNLPHTPGTQPLEYSEYEKDFRSDVTNLVNRETLAEAYKRDGRSSGDRGGFDNVTATLSSFPATRSPDSVQVGSSSFTSPRSPTLSSVDRAEEAYGYYATALNTGMDSLRTGRYDPLTSDTPRPQSALAHHPPSSLTPLHHPPPARPSPAAAAASRALRGSVGGVSLGVTGPVEVPKSGALTWEQLTALSQQRRAELRREREERERRRGLVIILSLGSLKDLIQQHQLLMLVLAVNVTFAAVFIKLLYG